MSIQKPKPLVDIPSYQKEVDFAELHISEVESSTVAFEPQIEDSSRKISLAFEPQSDDVYSTSGTHLALSWAAGFLSFDSTARRHVLGKLDTSSQKSNKRLTSRKSQFPVTSDSYSLHH